MNKLLEIISPEDRERAFQEVIGERFKYQLRWDYAGVREYCRHQRDIGRPLEDPPWCFT